MRYAVKAEMCKTLEHTARALKKIPDFLLNAAAPCFSPVAKKPQIMIEDEMQFW